MQTQRPATHMARHISASHRSSSHRPHSCGEAESYPQLLSLSLTRNPVPPVHGMANHWGPRPVSSILHSGFQGVIPQHAIPFRLSVLSTRKLESGQKTQGKKRKATNEAHPLLRASVAMAGPPSPFLQLFPRVRRGQKNNSKARLGGEPSYPHRTDPPGRRFPLDA